MKIIFKQFPTHIAKTNNARAPNKYVKINNQSIYNSNLNRFSRNIAVGNLHKYVIDIIPKGFKAPTPSKIHFVFKTPINHGSISRRNGIISWKPAKESYIPNWDIENLATLWVKVINDGLVKSGALPDDSVRYITGISYEFLPVENLKDREIIVNFIE